MRRTTPFLFLLFLMAACVNNVPDRFAAAPIAGYHEADGWRFSNRILQVSGTEFDVLTVREDGPVFSYDDAATTNLRYVDAAHTVARERCPTPRLIFAGRTFESPYVKSTAVISRFTCDRRLAPRP